MSFVNVINLGDLIDFYLELKVVKKVVLFLWNSKVQISSTTLFTFTLGARGIFFLKVQEQRRGREKTFSWTLGKNISQRLRVLNVKIQKKIKIED